jgi:hypothetical protein
MELMPFIDFQPLILILKQKILFNGGFLRDKLTNVSVFRNLIATITIKLHG